ncbi:hypothetical protein [Rhodococcus sp. IEGM 1330]|uniref:hypothetical protein n=1 Tax=Rhodococcus sp. IEGM 1330 TaxID=3082225 RepID=UPI002953E6E0|nr:hypothetical protein [Rhodococcus sp. IEGM 1330]MDV8024799.1 hypothetical protein [Rhodococcus sp. IEGM 1330]
MKLDRLAYFSAVAANCIGLALVAAPTASADVVELDILPGLSFGPTTPYGVGCTYVAVARTDGLNEPRTDIAAIGYDSIMPIEEFAWQFDPYFSIPAVLGHKITLWTPLTAGEHSLMAYQTSAGGPITTVTVNPATPLGPICLVAP